MLHFFSFRFNMTLLVALATILVIVNVAAQTEMISHFTLPEQALVRHVLALRRAVVLYAL